MKSFRMLMMAAFTILSVSVFAQVDKNTGKASNKKDQQLYACSMHPAVTSDKPGQCSQCGMNLSGSTKEKIKMGAVKQYSCPMHLDVTSNKPGKCPQCNMKLQKAKTTSMAYSCSMHPAVTSDKPGKCSKCGMDLTRSTKEKMKMETMKMYTCPMHADVTSNKPGKCSKCGMDLTKNKQ